MTYPTTPLVKFICFTTAMETEQARIGCLGLYLATYLAILPVSVRTMIRSMLRFRAALAAAAAVDSAVVIGSYVFAFSSSNRFL